MPGKRLDKNKFLQAKVQGLTNKDAAIAAGSTEKAAKQAGWRLSTNLEGEQSRMIALKKYAITWDLLVAKLTVMLNAEKLDNFTGEIKPDNTVQLAALKELAKMLTDRSKQDEQPQQNNQLNIPTNLNEVEIQKIMFRKSEE